MTAYEEGQLACQRGYLIKENPYNASETYLQRCQWDRGYLDVIHSDGYPKSILQKLSDEGISFYQRGGVVFARGYSKVNLDKKDLVDLKHYFESWISGVNEL